jgi:hypothetical protein
MVGLGVCFARLVNCNLSSLVYNMEKRRGNPECVEVGSV